LDSQKKAFTYKIGSYIGEKLMFGQNHVDVLKNYSEEVWT